MCNFITRHINIFILICLIVGVYFSAAIDYYLSITHKGIVHIIQEKKMSSESILITFSQTAEINQPSLLKLLLFLKYKLGIFVVLFKIWLSLSFEGKKQDSGILHIRW